MKKIYLSFALFFYVAVIQACQQPVPQDTTETVTINAPAEKVWSLIKNFGDIANWHSVVFTSTVTGGNETGATRVLTLKDGNTITEELTKYDDPKMSYNYKEFLETGLIDLKKLAEQ